MQKKVFGFLRLFALGAAFAFLFIPEEPGVCGSGTANVNVSANVINNCSISAAYNLAFGSYDPVVVNSSTGSDLAANGTISVTCTKSDSITIALGNGNNFSSPNRRMNNGTNYLNYNIYTAAGLGTVWNSTSTVTLTSTSAGTPTNFTMYGNVTKGQDLPAASYADTVVATITY